VATFVVAVGLARSGDSNSTDAARIESDVAEPEPTAVVGATSLPEATQPEPAGEPEPTLVPEAAAPEPTAEATPDANAEQTAAVDGGMACGLDVSMSFGESAPRERMTAATSASTSSRRQEGAQL